MGVPYDILKSYSCECSANFGPNDHRVADSASVVPSMTFNLMQVSMFDHFCSLIIQFESYMLDI